LVFAKFKDHIEDKENLKKLLQDENIIQKLKKDETDGNFKHPYVGLRFIEEDY